MHKKVALLVVVLCLALPVAAFAAGKQEPGMTGVREIRFLCQASPAGQKYAEVFSQFDRYGFKVTVEQVPWTTYLEKAQLAVQAKVSPYDVINANVEWVLPSYVTSESVLPLNDFMADEPLNLDEFLSITIDNVMWPKDSKYKPTGVFKQWDDGLLYGVPSLSDTTPLTYRKDWFAEAGLSGPPATWDDFLAVAQKLTRDTDGDGNPDRYAYAFAAIPEGGQLTDYWMKFVYANGADLLDVNYNPAFNNQKGVEATRFMAELLHKYKVVPPGVLTYGIPQAFDAYKKGVTAMTTQWGYALASVEDASESVAAGKSGYTAPPSKERIGARFAQWAYTIPTNSRDPEASWEFIQQASKLETQIALLPNVPPSRKRAAEEAIRKYPNNYLAGLMKTISEPQISIKPQIPNILEVDAAIAYPVFEALSGQKNVAAALAEAEKAAIPLLKQYK
jgi:multiple sugar transport system substrate-binding protein